jgi:hypothetical protein
MGVSIEQFRFRPGFQSFDMLRHSARRHMQLFSSSNKTLMTSSSLECA